MESETIQIVASSIFLLITIVIMWRIQRVKELKPTNLEQGTVKMKWKPWNKRSKKQLKAIEKERLEWLSRIKKEGVNPSYKLPSAPPTTAQGITCPRCGSSQVQGAYANRLECTECGRIFT